MKKSSQTRTQQFGFFVYALFYIIIVIVIVIAIVIYLL